MGLGGLLPIAYDVQADEDSKLGQSSACKICASRMHDSRQWINSRAHDNHTRIASRQM